jgi:hypothetical protein
MVQNGNRTQELEQSILGAKQELLTMQRTCTHPKWEFAREVHMETEHAHAVVRCTTCHKEETRDFFHNCPICSTALQISGGGGDRFFCHYSFCCPTCGFATTQRLLDY